MDNIRYGRLDASDEEVIQAAQQANADEFITRMPEGYNSELSEQGRNLSQGQRQLIAIARAILANPRLLILDEATSSVDTRTELLIQRALAHLLKGRTSFVIAHRLSTIRNADQLLVLEDGQIVERATSDPGRSAHEQLLDQGGAYYSLYTRQFRPEEALEAPASVDRGGDGHRPALATA
jgi:ATP-binding cassette subfamily B protein